MEAIQVENEGVVRGFKDLGCVPDIGTLSSPLGLRARGENPPKWCSMLLALRLRRTKDFLKSLVPSAGFVDRLPIAQYGSRKNFHG